MFNHWRKKIRKCRPILLTGAVLIILTAGFFVAGSSSVGSRFGWAKEEQKDLESGFIIAKPGTYDSADTAVIREIDREGATVTFRNLETGKNYTLAYDGTTSILDKYGHSMAVTQVREGDIVDVKFLKSKKKLAAIQLSENAWVFDNLKKYNFDMINQNADIGDDAYSLRDGTIVISDGKEASVEDIIRGDIVTVSGIGHNIYSVVVEQGHGYLRLSDDEYLKDGWIEVGQAVIQVITEDMLLAVPEGTYDVLLKAPGIEEMKKVTVLRNQEVVLDVSDVKVEEPKTGKIIFAVTPSETSIYIDGKEQDISQPVELEYGVHQMIAKAEGYDSVTQYIKVGQALASLTVSLEESIGEEKDTGSVSGNELSSSYRVYIDSPTGVEVYLDGVYMGMSPINFKKVAGAHTITLRKVGYVTKSYTIQLDDEPKDVTYSFSDLVRESSSGNITVSGNVPKRDGDSVSDNSVSDNSVSGN